MSTRHKKCTKCGGVKSLDMFRKRRDGKDGRRAQCEECVRERDRRYREENREAYAEYFRRYYEENREASRESRRRYHEENRNISRETATRSGMSWTKAEDSFLLSTDMTILEAAVELGRTLASVKNRKHYLRKNLQTN